MNKLWAVGGLLVLSVVLGATVLREPVAWAAHVMDVHVTNLDANGNVKVHEQGTASVHEAGTANVNVTNATVPVHEQGTASVSGTVGLSPAANTVKLDSSANTVRVDSSTPVGTRDVNDPTADPAVILRLANDFVAGSPCLAGGGAGFTVPAGKELVIEEIGAQAAPMDVGEKVALDFENSDSRGNVAWPVAMSLDPADSGAWFGAQQFRLYALPGDRLSVIGCRSGSSNASTGRATLDLSGYFVNHS